MAKKTKKKRQKKLPLESSRIGLDPDVLKSIWSIGLLSLAVLSVLSFFDLAGTLGELIKTFAQSAFGWGMYLLPVILIVGAVALILSWGRDNNKIIIAGAILFFLSLLGFLSMVSGEAASRGGYLGFLFTWPFINFLGSIGTFVALITFLIISFILTFNASVDKFITRLRDRRNAVSGAMEVEKITLGNSEKDKPEFRVKTLGEEQGEAEQKRLQSKFEKGSGKSAAPELDTKKKEKSEVSDFAKGAFSAKFGEFDLPPLDLLESEKGKPTSGDIVANANVIKRTFQNFGIDVEMGEVNVGPTVTQYTLKPAEGVKLSRIIGLNNDLSLALAAHPIRLEAPIPGRSLVGIEIPNKASSWVRLRNLISNSGFSEGEGLTLAIGRDVAGLPIYANLAKMPHMLIAGSTGSGKTIALNTLILSLLYKNPPQHLRLILVDPKRVEFSVFADIPHLLAPVVTTNDKAINALKWAVSEMERRFDVLSQAKARDIGAYNSNKKVVEAEGPLPYIVIVIDELADLMSSKGKEVEALIVRIAQMARAVGIHLVLATQRPSVEVITGLIKANITARMAFQVASQVDSRTILDMAGAEKLLGNGDMLFLSPERSKPRRIQGAFVRDVEVKKVGEYLREQKANMGEDAIDVEDFSKSSKQNAPDRAIDFDSVEDGDMGDDLYNEAKEIVIKSQKASASLLQRRLRIGYARAARILDILEENNIIGPGQGAKPRDVYLAADDLDTEEFLDTAENKEDETIGNL